MAEQHITVAVSILSAPLSTIGLLCPAAVEPGLKPCDARISHNHAVGAISKPKPVPGLEEPWARAHVPDAPDACVVYLVLTCEQGVGVVGHVLPEFVPQSGRVADKDHVTCFFVPPGSVIVEVAAYALGWRTQPPV